MNTIGIDYQQTLSIVNLGEGRGASARVRNIGDGLRPLIPNAVQGEEHWGSRALSAGGKPPKDLEDGPWLTEPDAPLFWGHLYRRIYAFLGRIAPTSQNGYRTVVSLQAADYASAATRVEKLCEQAGFGTPTCIPATDAVLARWLAEPQRAAGSAESVIAVVASGDTATTVCSYRIRHAAGSQPRIIARDTTAQHLPFGQAHWTGRLLIHVNDLFTEPLRPGYELALRDAALEFGARLRRAAERQVVTWAGPMRDKMYAPLQLTPEECRAWPEARRILTELPDMLRDSLTSLGCRGRPDRILVGGVGALWPFVARAAAGIGPVQQSESPEEDVARGAAWWPEVETFWGEALLGLDSMGAGDVLPDWLSGSQAEPDAAAFAVTESFVLSAENETVTPSFAFSDSNAEVSPVLFPGSFAADLSLETPISESFGGAAPADKEPFNPFEPFQEKEEGGRMKDESHLNSSFPVPASSSEYDIPLPKRADTLDEEEDLDNLPPWDPRRDEI